MHRAYTKRTPPVQTRRRRRETAKRLRVNYADLVDEGSLKLREMRILVASSAIALLWAMPALAAGKFAAPKGCTVYQTVQMHNCQVSNHYRCDGDAAGDQWSIYFGGDGPFYMSRIDPETRWIDSYDLTTGERDQLLDEADPASFSSLLESGRDSYEFTTKSSSGEVRHYSGFDEMTGEKVVIDGVTLDRTRFDLTAKGPDGELLWHRQGQQLVQRDWRIFFADRETFENGFGDRREIADTPVTFAGPGEPGFLSTKPEYDCDAMMTEADMRRGGAS